MIVTDCRYSKLTPTSLTAGIEGAGLDLGNGEHDQRFQLLEIFLPEIDFTPGKS
jgi:hypothetical protein